MYYIILHADSDMHLFADAVKKNTITATTNEKDVAITLSNWFSGLWDHGGNRGIWAAAVRERCLQRVATNPNPNPNKN